MHVCCAAPQAIHLEYFHDHVRVENLLFEGVISPQNGKLMPDLTRHGLGLDIRRSEISHYPAR
jgi:hypothetical protein